MTQVVQCKAHQLHTLFTFYEAKVACPKFGHPAKSSGFYNQSRTEFVAAVGILYENKKTPFED